MYNNQDNGTKVKNIPPELKQTYKELDKAGKMKAIKDRDYTLYGVLYFDYLKKYPSDWAQKHDPNLAKIYTDVLLENKLKRLMAMSWDELNKADLLNELKRIDANSYKQKFFDKFGIEPSW